MKLIVRGDDMGYCEAFNYGYVEAIRNGIVTSAELMIGMPGTEQAVEMLKEFPWIPVGWHVHVCGKPSADPKLVPRLLDENGDLCLRISRGHPQDPTLYDELYIELKAELDKFIELMGKKPDMISNVDDRNDPYSCVLRELAEQYHINHLFRDFTNQRFSYHKWIETENGWTFEDYPFITMATHGRWESVQAQADNYKPKNLFLETYSELLSQEEGVGLIVFHPGYVDGFILDYTTCNLARCRDVQALTDKEVRKHLDDLGVELITSSDYLYGTHDYQDYDQKRKAKK